MVISKSEYMMFLKHPAWLWLKKYDKNKLPAIDDNLQALFDEGTLFESLAEQTFDGAVKLGYKHANGEFSSTMYYALPEETQKEINKGTKVILQGRLEVDGLTSIFDAIELVEDGVFDLYEIKSSTGVKAEHIPDLAFQTVVLEKAGLKVRKMFVLHVNNEYVRDGEVDKEAISKRSEVTEEVREIIDETIDNIERAKKVLANKNEMPDISPRHLKSGGDTLSEWMEIFQAVKGELPTYSIYNLASVDPKTIGWLEDQGIEVLQDIPLDAPLSKKQLRQVEAMRSGEQKVDEGEIRDFINSLEYPLYFFDYETMAGVIPAFDGYRPYQQVPFQYSLHIQEKPGAELIHKEYLHSENTDPVPSLLKQMKEDFGGKGSVISWYMPFEKGRNSEMAKTHKDSEKFLLNINDRMVDLMVPFSKGWFVDKDFFGSASIKSVLPVLLPDLTYKNLNIQNGGVAQRVWMETVLKGKNPEKKQQILEDLRKYCELDTYAMVAIFKYLCDRVRI